MGTFDGYRAAGAARAKANFGRTLGLAALLFAACDDETPRMQAIGSAQPPPTGGGAAPVAGAASTAGDPGLTGTGGGAPAGGTGDPVTTAGTMSTGQPGGGMGSAGEGGTLAIDPPTPGGSQDWAMMGYDHGSTFWNRGETTITKDNAVNLKEAWSVDLGGNVYGAPLQIGDVIYASGPSTVRALDAASGDERWKASVSSSGSLAYDDGTLYIHSRTANIVALDAATGSEKWSKPLNPTTRGDGTSSPLVAGDVVLAGGSNGGIELLGGSFRGFLGALERDTGAVAWTEYTVPTGAKGASIWSSPAADIAAGRAYATTGNNYGPPATDTSDAIIAFELATGAVVWKSQSVKDDAFSGATRSAGPDADFGANPVVYDTMVDGAMTRVVASGNKGGLAHAVRAQDGSLLWDRTLCAGTADGSKGIFTNSAWTGKYMVFACNIGPGATLFALDGATGEIGWMRDLPGLVWGRTAIANGVGFVGTGNKLEVFDADTGAHIVDFTSKGGTVAGTITVAHGRVAFGDGLTWSSGVRGSHLTVLALP